MTTIGEINKQLKFCKELFTRAEKDLNKELKNPARDSYENYYKLDNRYRIASDFRRIRREILTLTKMLEGAEE